MLPFRGPFRSLPRPQKPDWRDSTLHPNCWSHLVNSLGGQYMTKSSTREKAGNLTGTRTAKTAQAVQVESDLLRQWHQLGSRLNHCGIYGTSQLVDFRTKPLYLGEPWPISPAPRENKNTEQLQSLAALARLRTASVHVLNVHVSLTRSSPAKVQQILLQLSGTKERDGDLHQSRDTQTMGLPPENDLYPNDPNMRAKHVTIRIAA